MKELMHSSYNVWADGTFSFYREPQKGRTYEGFFNYDGEGQGYYCWAGPEDNKDDVFVGHADTLENAVKLVMKRPIVEEKV